MYGTSLFTCRVKKCPRAVHGFASLAERDKHEQAHVQDFRCSYPQCDAHRDGIGSAKKLKEHMEQFHPELPKRTEMVTAFGQKRTDTETTLVNPEPEPGGEEPREHRKAEASSGSDSGESEEYTYGDDWIKDMTSSTRFAVNTISVDS